MPSDADEIDYMKRKPYRELVGSLLYLSNTTRPDIYFAVGMLSRFMENPGTKHWHAAGHVLRYLRYTSTMGITYKSNMPLQITTYSDADFAGDPDTRKSTSGYVLQFLGGAISWRSKKQTITAQSTVEAETIALSFAVREILWIKKLLKDLNLSASFAQTICVDNRGCIAICKEGSITDKTKHIGIKLGLAKDNIQSGNVTLQYTPNAEIAADILTKQLPRARQDSNLQQLGMKNN